MAVRPRTPFPHLPQMLSRVWYTLQLGCDYAIAIPIETVPARRCCHRVTLAAATSNTALAWTEHEDERTSTHNLAFKHLILLDGHIEQPLEELALQLCEIGT